VNAEIQTEELKALELGVLRYIHRKCRENGLRYYLMFGTLLGAVRHKGFIPWDDDIDIAMTRPDFKKLMDLAEADQDSPYKVVSMFNVKDFSFPLAKMVDTRTRLVQYSAVGTHEKLGVYVDIFLIDAVPDIEEEYRAYLDRAKAAKHAWYLAQRRFMLRRGQLAKDICVGLASLPFKLRSSYAMAKKMDETCAAYAGADTKREGVVMMVDKQDASTLTRAQWADTVELEFEGERFTAVSCWDEMLRRTYGDYMQLPPPEQRVSIHDFKVYWRDGATKPSRS
jgi:phosphorylcholine metabolism protein LicD